MLRERLLSTRSHIIVDELVLMALPVYCTAHIGPLYIRHSVYIDWWKWGPSLLCFFLLT